MTNIIPLVIADLELQLATTLAVGGTSFTLSASVDDDAVSIPAGLYCFTLDNGTSNKEYLIGQVNGTAVTSVKSVSRQGAETTGAARKHRIGAPCILTDFATIQRVQAILTGDSPLDGASPIVYDAEPTLVDRKEVATVGYVLDLVAGGTVAFDAQTIAGNAGESVVAGNLVYFKTSDQEWYKTDADTTATIENVQLGIALGSGSDGVTISGGVQISGTYTTTGLTAGSLYYASNTAGAVATSAGTTSQVVGIALSTTKLLIIPRNPKTLNDYQLTALTGDATPSSVNKFLTKGKAMVAGATINGATLPVPVYQNKTDNEFYACDGNDTGALKFLGFAISNAVDGGAMNVQFSGIVSGFTGLAEGEKYYLQDTVGTIGTTIGTYEVLVGVAISETELLIQKGRRRAGGNGGSLGTASSSLVVTCGFRPTQVKVFALALPSGTASTMSVLDFTWVNGAIVAANAGMDGGSGGGLNNSAILYMPSSLGNYMTFTITSVTDTGFTITWTETGSFNPSSIFYWSAEGEL